MKDWYFRRQLKSSNVCIDLYTTRISDFDWHVLKPGLDCGLWTVDYGLWTMDCGLWTVDYGLWTVDYGLCPSFIINRWGIDPSLS